MQLVRGLAAVLFIVALPVLLVTANVRFLASEPRFYERGFDKYDVEERTGLPRSELDRSAREIIDYFSNDQDQLDVLVNDGGAMVPLFSEREVLHMEDVKGLFSVLFRAQEVALVFVAVYAVGVFVWAREARLTTLAKQVLIGLGVLLAVVAGVGLFAAVGFEDLWRQFHLVSFSNDFWELSPARDRLIQMFPVAFWEEATFILAAITAAEMAVLAALSGGYLWWRRRGEEASTPGLRAEPVSQSG